jgi:hypothetical protein
MPDFNLRAEVEAERAKYPALLTDDQPAKILNAVALAENARIGRDDWGLSAKPHGNHVPSPQGVLVAYDILHNRRPEPGHPHGRLFDALTDDLKGTVTWGETIYHGDPVNRPWVAPVRLGPAPKPDTPKPAPAVKVTYDRFVHHESHEIRKAYAKRNGHDSMTESDLAHTLWRRLVERWTFRDVIHDILGEPYEDGGMGGDK